MQCINKLKAGFDRAGDLTFSPRKMSKEYSLISFECRKCLPCRLNVAREKALRAWHESKMHKEPGIFLTLTYNKEHLKSPYLVYEDFQNFMKSLRELVTRDITDPDVLNELRLSYMVTGEYGEKNKRPHWHALIFNFRPSDEKFLRSSETGEKVFTSQILSDLWKKGLCEYGSITIDSAGYVARYAAKKLVHGKDDEHQFHPIHKTSSKNAIGKSWIERYWKQTFDLGYVYLPNGQKSKIPRYYVDWLKKNQPDAWRCYVTQLRHDFQVEAEKKNRKEELEYLSELFNQKPGEPRPITRAKVKTTILNSKFKRLQEKLKL